MYLWMQLFKDQSSNTQKSKDQNTVHTGKGLDGWKRRRQSEGEQQEGEDKPVFWISH